MRWHTVDGVDGFRHSLLHGDSVVKRVRAPVLRLLCVQVLLLEMCVAYNALRAGEQPELPPVRLQYPDFAAWHARRAASDAVVRQVSDLLCCFRSCLYDACLACPPCSLPGLVRCVPHGVLCHGRCFCFRWGVAVRLLGCACSAGCATCKGALHGDSK